MSKHTPGPWKVVLSDNATPHVQHIHGVDWTYVCDLSSRVCVMPAEITSSYNSLANARLIAAAPELLEALHGLLNVISETRGLPAYNAVLDAQKAIAKADGKQ